jgi:predicted small integral membrane protein
MPNNKGAPLSKFIQTVDEAGDQVIINLEAIAYIEKAFLGLTVHFQDNYVVLKGEQADIFWEVMTEVSSQAYKPQEDKK